MRGSRGPESSSPTLVGKRSSNSTWSAGERRSAHGSKIRTTCYKRPMRRHDYAPRPAHIKWLLDSDPAIRWQVMRDLSLKVERTSTCGRPHDQVLADNSCL